MAQSLVTVLKISGNDSIRIRDSLTRYAQKRQQSDPMEFSADDWSKSLKSEMDGLVVCLLSSWKKRSFLYAAKYITNGTVADDPLHSIHRELTQYQNAAQGLIATNKFTVWFLSQSYDEELQAVRSLKRKRYVAQQAPDRLLNFHVIEACSAGIYLNVVTLIVVVAESLGPTVLEEEII